mgnify:CR=1 FL=1
MVRGLYTAYTGLVNQQRRLDIVSNNLANATTTGYKKEGVTTQSFDSVYGIKINDATVGYMNQSILPHLPTPASKSARARKQPSNSSAP